MTTTQFLARCAPLALATAALHSTPAAAQDAAPVIVLDPAPAPAPSAAPIVLPSPVATAATAPVATPEVAALDVEAATPAAAPTRTTTAQRSIPARRAVPAQAASEPVAAAPTLATEPSAPALATADAAIDPSPVEAAPAVEQPAAAPSSDIASDALLFGLLGMLGLGAAGYALTRRRRHALAAPEIERPVVAEERVAPAPLPATPAVLAAAPAPRAAERPAAPAYAWNQPSAPNNGAAVALPNALPDSFEERDALLRRMIEAEPDRANPFQSPRARARRARLIMQSLGRSFANRKPRIDLSQYTNTWPALRGWQPATA